jgi:hypothetical protein
VRDTGELAPRFRQEQVGRIIRLPRLLISAKLRKSVDCSGQGKIIRGRKALLFSSYLGMAIGSSGEPEASPVTRVSRAFW